MAVTMYYALEKGTLQIESVCNLIEFRTLLKVKRELLVRLYI